MVNYLTLEEIKTLKNEQELIQVAPLEGDEDLLDEALITQVIGIASSYADSYISGRIILPLSSVPEALKAAVADITVYEAALTSQSMSETIQEKYKSAIEWLKNISKGIAILPVTEPAEVTNDGNVVLSRDPVFTDELFDGYLS